MKCPVNYISLVQGFNNGKGSKHYGLDLGWFSNEHHNQPVYACDDGVVVYNRRQITGGYVIQIKHDNGLISEYGHLLKDSQRVHEGDKVKKGQQIAQMGASGMVTGEHLHFAILKSNKSCFTKSLYVNPINYINVYTGQIEANNVKTKGKFKHTKIVKGTDGELNVRKTNLKGKVVYRVKENNDIESYGVKNGLNIVDNVRDYVCSNKFTK